MLPPPSSKRFVSGTVFVEARGKRRRISITPPPSPPSASFGERSLRGGGANTTLFNRQRSAGKAESVVHLLETGIPTLSDSMHAPRWPGKDFLPRDVDAPGNSMCVPSLPVQPIQVRQREISFDGFSGSEKASLLPNRSLQLRDTEIDFDQNVARRLTRSFSLEAEKLIGEVGAALFRIVRLGNISRLNAYLERQEVAVAIERVFYLADLGLFGCSKDEIVRYLMCTERVCQCKTLWNSKYRS
jgi:hypothetical protein